MSYVYQRSEPGLWTVGYYLPDGKWVPESDHGNEDKAAGRVHWLNGGSKAAAPGMVRVEDNLDYAMLRELQAMLADAWSDKDGAFLDKMTSLTRELNAYLGKKDKL